ncbi:fibrobacter succinogenes major paralogous domain-containing protein [Flavobacteriales bacterium]|nr:fibrobacter succinogenes major paralogous domain-containing protein [Flavobacteriales bacterium]
MNKDLDGDLLIGAGDVLELLSSFGEYLDADGDGIPDCQDDCVGTFDTCGVCNGPGPQVLAIDTIIITYDSVYVDAINEWLLYELSIDTLLHLVCSNPGCTDPIATNFDPYAQEGGLCEYGGPCLGPTYDGHTYSAIQIGDQCWFAENLRTQTYTNGDTISSSLNDSDWISPSGGANSVYGEGLSNCTSSSTEFDACDEGQSLAAYGRLYNWYAVNDGRGLCPNGWHVPSDMEWTTLVDYVALQGFTGMEGTALKATSGWNNELNGTDNFNFTGLPAGLRSGIDHGNFTASGITTRFWTSTTAQIGVQVWYRSLKSEWQSVPRGYTSPTSGCSVRCLRDSE